MHESLSRGRPARAWAELLLSDFVVSFLWVWSGSILRILALRFLGIGAGAGVGVVGALLAVLYVSSFAWLGKATGGGSYNPLIVLCHAVSGDFAGFLFAVFARVPAQVIGSILGVRVIKAVFPEVGYGPRLNVDIHQGTLTEGLLTFMIVIVSLGLKRMHPKSSVTRTWISSISKVTFHFLGSDLTGGIMNPATVYESFYTFIMLKWPCQHQFQKWAFGWALVQGEHMTKEHLIVYWLAPIEGTMLGVWTCSLFVKLKKPKVQNRKRYKEVKME